MAAGSFLGLAGRALPGGLRCAERAGARAAQLTQLSGESAAFYVREGHVRTCLVRVEGPQALRHHARMGEGLPLDKGSPGRVILAFSGEPGEIYEQIRQKGYHCSIGEREQGVATVSAPVFGMHWRLMGSVCISGPCIAPARGQARSPGPDRDRRQPTSCPMRWPATPPRRPPALCAPRSGIPEGRKPAPERIHFLSE
jgi:hypothetical protein